MLRFVFSSLVASKKWFGTAAYQLSSKTTRKNRRGCGPTGRELLRLELLEDRRVPASLFASSYFDGAVYQFDSSTGTLQNTLVAPNTPSLLSGPSGLAVGPDGNLYISSQLNNAILEYNLTTKALSTFIPSTVLQPIAQGVGNSSTNFAPAGLKFGPDGDLYVSLNGGTTSTLGAVVRFDITSGTGGLTYNSVFSVIDTAGLVQPTGMTFGVAAGDTNDLYVSNSGAGTVVKISGATTASPTAATFITAGSGGLNYPAGLTFGPDGMFYVTDLGATSNMGNILRFNTNGTFDDVYAQPNSSSQGSLQFEFPSDSEFDSQGNLFVANLGPAYPPALQGAIFEYNSTGTYSQTLVSSSQFPNTGTGESGISPSQIVLASTPEFTSSASISFATGSADSFAVTVTGLPTPTLTETGPMPTGVTFNAATGVFSGTPAAGTNGVYSDTITASNGINPNATQVFTLTVTGPIDELGAYRSSNGSWSLDSDGTPGFNSVTDQVFYGFSPPGAIGVAGDWTGKGVTEIGSFKNGVWLLDLNDNGVLVPSDSFTFGQAGDTPVVGDWNGDGKTDLGVFRAAPDGITGEFILDTNETHIMGPGDETFTFGLATDHVIVGDWNGAGKDEVGVFRNAASYIAADAGDAVFSLDTNGDHMFGAGDQVFVFGLVTDGVIIGHWNGGTKSEIGVYRDASTAPVGNPLYAPGTALFSLDTNGDGVFDTGDQVFLYGLSSDQFVSGHWAKTPPLQPEGTPQ